MLSSPTSSPRSSSTSPFVPSVGRASTADRRRPAAWAAVLLAIPLALAFALSACDATDSRAPSGASDFSSFAPSSGELNGAKAGDSASAAAGGESGQGETVKVEEGDVARLWGDKLLVLNRWRGLQVVDLSDPAKPALLQRLPMHGTPREMYVADGYATVLLSQVYGAKVAGDSLQTFAGSELRVIQLNKGSDAKEIAAVAVDGWIAQSKRIGGKLVLVTTQSSWSPWYWGWCYGPYPCMDAAEGGVKAGTASASATGDAASGAAAGAPAGDAQIMPGYGDSAQGGSVVVYDQSDLAKTSLVGAVDFEGGAQLMDIRPGEVLVAGAQYSYDAAAKKSTYTDRMTQVLLNTDGKPTLGAVWKQSQSTSPHSYLMRAARLDDGRVVRVTRSYQPGGKSTQQVSQFSIESGAFKALASWQSDGTISWPRIQFLGDKLLFAGTVYTPKTIKEDPTDDPKGDTDPPDDPKGEPAPDKDPAKDPAPDPKPDTGGESSAGSSVTAGVAHTRVQVISLAKGSTITVAGSVDLPQGAYLQGSFTPLPTASAAGAKPAATDALLMGWRDKSKHHHLDLLDVSAAPVVTSGLTWGDGTYSWAQTQVLPTGLLLVTTSTYKDGKSSHVTRLVTSAGGKLVERGQFTSPLLYWSQLKALDAGALLLRVSNQALEVIDKKDLNKPTYLSTLELAADVRDVVWVNGRAVALVRSLTGAGLSLRTLKSGAVDEAQATATLQIKPTWGRLSQEGTTLVLAAYDGLYLYDYSAPDAPKQVGFWSAKSDQGYGYSPWNLPKLGPHYFILTRKGTFVPDDPAACKQDGAEPTQGGGSSGASGADPDEAGSAKSGAADEGAENNGDKAGEPDKEPGNPASCTGKTEWTTTLRAVSIATPSKPQVVGTLTLKGSTWLWAAQLSGSTLFMTHYEALKGADGSWKGKYYLDRIDVSDPTKMKALAKINVPGRVMHVAPKGDRVWTVSYAPVAGSDPKAYQVEATLNALQLYKDKAYLQSQLLLPGHPGAVATQGDAMYLATWQYPWQLDKTASPTAQPKQQLHAIDLNGAKKNKLILSKSLDSGSGVTRLTLAGGKLYAGVGWNAGLAVVDISAPLKLMFTAFLPVNGYAWRVVPTPNGVLVPAGWFGLSAW